MQRGFLAVAHRIALMAFRIRFGMTISYLGSQASEPMSAAEKRTFSLPTEQASYIDSLVASGTYASASEVVRAGLRALQERDAGVRHG